MFAKKLFTIATALLCFSMAQARSTSVSTPSTINSAVKAAFPGDTIYIENGTYSNTKLLFTANGTAENPIVICARENGKVVFDQQSNLRMSGSYMEIRGLVFKNGYSPSKDAITFRAKSGEYANSCRLTECVIDAYNNPNDKEKERWVLLYGKNNRVDHCLFTGKVNEGVLMAVVLEEKNDSLSRVLCGENSHRIDHNVFSNRPILVHTDNGGEIIRLGDSYTSLMNSRTIVENNYLEHCDGEVEYFSIKSCENIIRNNYIYESAGAIVLRHGHRNLVENNVIIGNGKKNAAGIRVINNGHTVRNNYLQDLVGKGSYSAFTIMNGLQDSPDNGYHTVRNVLIENNILVNCENVTFNHRHSSKVRAEFQTLTPENVTFANNNFYNDRRELKFNLLEGAEGIKGITFSDNKINSNVWPEPKIKGWVLDKKMAKPQSPTQKPTDVGINWYK